ncbi:MAG TPA: triose-phosphate isomerase [Holosporales bacterium]|nr:triose-phosphate isomerase [Holosporales bacterium]
MDKKYIVANWKMNGDFKLVQQYQDFFSQHVIKHHVVVCPPYPFLDKIQNSTYHVGAQNCHVEKAGAFTGSISAAILKNCNTQYVILGHSERRTQFNETNEQILQKVNAALNEDLIPIICIGETLQQKESREARAVITKQLEESIPITQKKVIIAYEPIWAIGTGHVPSSEDIESMHALIRRLYPTIPILYGGSVNKNNIHSILNIKNVDGVLVGGASLDISFFETLI